MAVADGCLIRQPRVGRRSEVLCAGAGPGPWCPMFSFFLPVLCLSPELAQAPYPVDISGAGWGGAWMCPTQLRGHSGGWLGARLRSPRSGVVSDFILTHLNGPMASGFSDGPSLLTEGHRSCPGYWPNVLFLRTLQAVVPEIERCAACPHVLRGPSCLAPRCVRGGSL